MCGIAGWLSLDPARPPDTRSLARMLDVLRHRGPDDQGTWVDGGVGLGCCRLAVIDPSPRARQPIGNEDGSVQVVLNGEIYNFAQLRDELESRGHRFRSAGDAEVVAHLYEALGPACLERLRGMFALGLWDARRRTLFLARDRLGKKPLYHTTQDGCFLFASEAKALLQVPGIQVEPDPEAIHRFLTHGYVPGSGSAFRRFGRLPPAHYLVIQDGRMSVHRYWSLCYTPQRSGGESELAEELLARLDEAVRLRLRADVPLGVLLSGGLDSGTVTALARRHHPGALSTFTAGFGEPAHDERAYARLVADRLGTEAHELVVSASHLAALPRIAWHHDEPFADSSVVATFALCELAARSVTVALSGDGGDESFAGYDRHVAAAGAAWTDRLPAALRRLAAWAIRHGPPGRPGSVAARLGRFGAVADLAPWRRYARWLAILDERERRDLYTPDFQARVSHLDPLAPWAGVLEDSDAPTAVERAMHADIARYLPDDLLVKMDVASMAHGLEIRSPFLDHHVVELAASLPAALKLRRLTRKYVLRRLMAGQLPDAVLRRRKQGFRVPLDEWFGGAFAGPARAILLDTRACQRGYVRPAVVRRYLDAHAAGQASHGPRLFALVMLELWHRTFVDRHHCAEPLPPMSVP